MQQIIDALKSKVTLPEGKDKTVYILLAIFLGGFGVHNFWAGNEAKAKAQLICGLAAICCIPLGIVGVVTAILDIVEVCQAK